MNTEIIIAMHKEYDIPEDRVYLPLHVGSTGKETIDVDRVRRDDDGDNISRKNPYYCELTGLYWMWKNLDADALGMVHYRRYFKGKYGRINMRMRDGDKRETAVLGSEETDELMRINDIIVPKKRRYYIESLYSHYGHTLDNTHLDIARDVVRERCPEYLSELESVYSRSWGYMFNMFIMRREYLDEYCRWLFEILSEMENRIVMPKGAFESRLYGRVSEILFNVWLLHEQNTSGRLRVSEIPAVHLEPVNWLRKGGAFLTAKFFGKKYESSF